MQSPSGSGGDVAKDKRPVRYTGTGVGSPAAAFLSPETSSMALKSRIEIIEGKAVLKLLCGQVLVDFPYGILDYRQIPQQ